MRRKRRSPIRHPVMTHTRNGKTIRSYHRGSGKSSQRSSKVVTLSKIPKSEFPNWFPDWLYHQLSPEEASNFLGMIRATNMGPQEVRRIPSKVYHVTSNADKILTHGFKTAEELGVSGFGGSGDYISVTTQENAKHYLDSMRIATRVMNNTISLDELGEWITKQSGPDTWKEIEVNAKARADISNIPLDDPRTKWDAFRLLAIYAPKGTGASEVLYMDKPTSLIGKDPRDIQMLEVVPDESLRFRHKYNIFRKEEMKPYYTYNVHELEWRIWDPRKVKPVRVVG